MDSRSRQSPAGRGWLGRSKFRAYRFTVFPHTTSLGISANAGGHPHPGVALAPVHLVGGREQHRGAQIGGGAAVVALLPGRERFRVRHRRKRSCRLSPTTIFIEKRRARCPAHCRFHPGTGLGTPGRDLSDLLTPFREGFHPHRNFTPDCRATGLFPGAGS